MSGKDGDRGVGGECEGERYIWSEKYLFKARRSSLVILRRSRVRIMNLIVLTKR